MNGSSEVSPSTQEIQLRRGPADKRAKAGESVSQCGSGIISFSRRGGHTAHRAKASSQR
ncbi:uncharacterized protein DAT39_019670 [Clarias magur]|uniref:Uncharacterized protein n=1 Tax=Clarias magur TaxID=1594786 RepID=A0A8J4WTR5_CLAMG|nr:uncharacterized protein DAT39_019670 [Clarias magur]